MADNITPELMHQKDHLVERCCIGCIEAMEDRAPTFEEVATYFDHIVEHRLEIFTWKGIEIVRVKYFPTPGKAFEIYTRVNPFAALAE